MILSPATPLASAALTHHPRGAARGAEVVAKEEALLNPSQSRL